MPRSPTDSSQLAKRIVDLARGEDGRTAHVNSSYASFAQRALRAWLATAEEKS
ncbi:MAG: hypothetical protein OXK76_02445 [Gammaproteobacteria bacterium]|nr:hypothetical protein [Gammaproteobacteria bacterium]